MGGSLSKIEEEFKASSDASDVQRLQKAANDKDAGVLNAFKLFEDKEKEYDFVSYLITHSPRSANLTPFFQVLKDKIVANRASKEQKDIAAPSKKFDYIDLLIEKQMSGEPKAPGDDLEAFRFLIDAVSDGDIFPSKAYSGNDFSPRFHRLCSSDRFVEHVRLLISAGLVDDRFKNTNGNDGMKKEVPKITRSAATPLEAAAGGGSKEIIQELCVSGLGGNNYADAVKALFDIKLETFGLGKVDEKIEEKIDADASDIVLCFISQSGAKDQIRDFVYDSWTFAREAKFIGTKKLRETLVSNGCE